MNSGLWLLIVILTGCIGCFIYLIIREPIGGTQNYQQPEPTLGNSKASIIRKEQRFCTNCGMELEEGAIFCTGCGIKL
jgi:hypothetical protein